jgi:ketosteroid isomerase-like protein
MSDNINNLEAQVLEAEERLRQAMLHNDVRALDELISPDLLFTGHLGQLASKADDLAAHEARLLRLQTIEPVERHIQVHPNFAVVSVLMHLVGTYEGAPIDQQMRYTRVWSISPDGSVQIVAGHMSEIQSD